MWPIAVESIRVAGATRVISGTIALLAVALPLAVTGITGLNIEGQAKILDAVDSVGARLIVVVSPAEGPTLSPRAVDRIATLSGVAWVVGLGQVSDVRSGIGVGPAPIRLIRARRAPIAFESSPLGAPAKGVYLSRTSAVRLGLGGAYGAVFPGAVPVVGWFRTSEPLGTLEGFALEPSDDDTDSLERIIVSVDDPGWVDITIANIRALLGAEAGSSSDIQASAALLAARSAVNDEVARRDRVVVLALLASGMVLASLVVLAGAIAGRRDFGRRRALGATRPQLIMLVMLSTAWPAMVGSGIGALVGWVSLSTELGQLADARYPAAIGILAVIALTATSALPAAYAATRDPLQVLRVP